MIDTSNWKEFRVGDLFEIINGKGLTIEEIEENTGVIPVIQGGSSDNGVIGYISEKYCRDQKYVVVTDKCLTVARVGTSGYVNYQDDICAIGDKCKALILKSHKSVYSYLFLQAVLQCLQYKYSYGRGLSTEGYADEVLELPATSDGNPDWDWIEQYMGGYYHGPLTTSIKSSGMLLETDKWGEFRVGDLFRIENCKCGNAGDLDDGDDIWYVGAKKEDNGLMRKVQIVSNLVTKGNCIVFICDGAGSVGYTNYMPEDFIGSTTVSVGYSEKLTPLRALFIVSVMDMERFKYDYGRKMRKYLNDTIIRLPVAPDGSPDWEWMESYMKSLPYSDRI